ncbi:MAG TPA: DUF1206 domain-containing protein [Streptosporangiaceae bacterium]
MATWTARRRAGRSAKSTGRRAANSAPLRWLGRAGYAARGVLYVMVGSIAIQAAFGQSGQQADKSGVLQEISSTPVGGVLIWLLVAGFIGMALWRLSDAAYPESSSDDGTSSGSGSGTASSSEDGTSSSDSKGSQAASKGSETAKRVAALVKAVIYAVIAYSVLKFAIGGGTQSSDKESVDLTATVMKYPGGQVLVVVAGLALIGGGVFLAYAAWKEKFRKNLELGQIHGRLQRVVVWLGKFGGIARGAVFVTAGVFLVIAAIEAKPQQAKGVDSALRVLASTPLGPWLLLLVAIGLIMFGLFSLCQARWERL